MSHDVRAQSNRKGNTFASAPGLVLLGFLFAAGALLFTEHRAHIVLGAFIWLILIAALALPAFTHGGWRGTVGRGSKDPGRRDAN